MAHNEFDIIVIGAGPGGAPCAALLAKKGFKVLLLEGNNQAGGKAITVRKQGFAYELWPIAGAPVLGGRFEQLQQILGLGTSLTLAAPEDRPAVYYYLDRNGNYHASQIPHPEIITDPAVLAAKGQQAFFEMVQWLQLREDELGSIIKLATEQAALTDEDISKLDDVSYHEFLSRYGVPQPFYSLCAMGTNVAYAVPIDQVSASEYILTDRQITGNSGYFTKGGYSRLFELCVEALCALGGTAKFGKRVEKILVENNQVEGVVTAEGKFHAPVVISNAGIQPTVLKLVGKEYFDASYINRVKSLVPAFGCVGTRYFMDVPFFKEPYNLVFSDKSYFNVERMARVAEGEIPDDLLIFNVMPSVFDSSLAPEGKQCVLSLIFCPADPAFEYKQPMRDKLDQCMERAWPGFLSHVASREYYTPRDISNLSREQVLPGIGGECIGLGQVVGQSGKNKPNPASPVTGLFYVGCDSAGHGVGTNQAVDSAFNVADLVEKHIQTRR